MGKKKPIHRCRRNKGETAALLCIMLSAVVLMFSIFAFELERYMLVQDQLRACVGSAALAFETSLLSSQDANQTANVAGASNVALAIFQMNSIQGQALSGAVMAPDLATLGGYVTPGASAICIQFLDPITHQPFPNVPTNIAGAVVRVTG